MALTNSWALAMRTANLRKARSRTIASSLSRKTTGSLVPHLRSRKVLLETKTTAAWNGEVPPNGMLSSRVRIGTFWVARVCRPGPKVSSALPSRKNTACWLSSTISWLPSRMSQVPSGGTRATIVCPSGSWYWMTSIVSSPVAAPVGVKTAAHVADPVAAPFGGPFWRQDRGRGTARLAREGDRATGLSRSYRLRRLHRLADDLAAPAALVVEDMDQVANP